MTVPASRDHTPAPVTFLVVGGQRVPLTPELTNAALAALAQARWAAEGMRDQAWRAPRAR